MTQSPVLTPQQLQSVEMIQRSERLMMTRIMQAIEDSAKDLETGLKSIQFEDTVPHRDYFVAVAHRLLLLALCGADPETGQGGDPVLATAILDSDRNFVSLHWKGKTHDPDFATSEAAVAEAHVFSNAKI